MSHKRDTRTRALHLQKTQDTHNIHSRPGTPHTHDTPGPHNTPSAPHTHDKHDKQCLIRESESMERNQEAHKNIPSKLPAKKAKTQKQTGNFHSPTKHCGHHGKNKGHNSDQCWVLHPELKPQPDSTPNQKQGFLNNAAQKEIDFLAKQEKKTPVEIASMKMEQHNKTKDLLTENKEKKAEKEQLAIEEMEEMEVSSSDESESSCNKMKLDKPIPRKGWKKSTRVPKGKEQTNPLPILKKKKCCVIEEEEEDNLNETTDIPEEEIAHHKLTAEAQEKL